MNKYVCPICGAKIRYWNEFFFYKKQTINPITGQYGRVIKTEPQEHNCGDMHGFERSLICTVLIVLKTTGFMPMEPAATRQRLPLYA
jgi:hypothetical protein